MHLKTNCTFFLTLVFVALTITALAVQAAAVPDPTEQMKPFIDKMTKMLSDPKVKNDSECNSCKRIIDVSRERFDYNEMSKRVLGKTWRKLSAEEKKEFVNLFTELLQYAYIGKIEDYAGQPIVFKQQRIKGNRAEVKTELIDKDKSIHVSYIMLLKGDQWMAYDVVVEGVSLVRNYLEQFREILRKDKYSGLVKQLKEKIKQLEAERNQRIAQRQG